MTYSVIGSGSIGGLLQQFGGPLMAQDLVKLE